MKPIYIFIFFVFIALAVGLSFYFAKDNSTVSDYVVPLEQTENVYQNQSFGFRVRYPDEWGYFIKSASADIPFAMEFSDDENYVENAGPLGPGAFPDKRISLVLYKTSRTLAQYSTDDLEAKKAKIISSQDTIISGQQGLIVKSEFQGTYLSAYVMKGEHIYIFESNIKKQDNVSDVETVFNTLISNFEFTN